MPSALPISMLQAERLRLEYDRMEDWKESRCRCCPKCGRIVEKLSGCDIMVCGKLCYLYFDAALPGGTLSDRFVSFPLLVKMLDATLENVSAATFPPHRLFGIDKFNICS